MRAKQRFHNTGLLLGLGSAILLSVVPLYGCGALTALQNTPDDGEASVVLKETVITGEVASVEPDTGLPETLSGTVTGDYEGGYQETILELFFDCDGVPIAAVSRSQFTIDTPEPGTITSLNLILVVEPIVSSDQASQAVPVGLATAATGEIIHGTGAFEDTVGQLHSDSTVLFGGGEFGLGTLESALTITLNQ
jgi:hypothetical protein